MTGPTGAALDSDRAPSIDCQEVREALSAPSRAVGLTEWALVHAHVARCPECQKQRESFQLAVSSQRVEPSPGSGVKLLESARALVTRGASQVPTIATPSARLVATSIGRARFVIARVLPRLMSLRSSLGIAFHRTARGTREAVGGGATRAIGLVSRLGALGSIALTASTQAGARLIEGSRARVIRMGRQTPVLVAPAVRATGHVAGYARSMITRVPHLLVSFGSSLAVAFHRTARGTREAVGGGTTRANGLVGRLGVLGSIALTASTHAGARLIEGSRARVIWVARRLPMLVTPSVRAAGHVTGHVRFAIARVPHAVIRFRSPLMAASRETARAASEAADAGAAWVLRLLDRLGAQGSILARSAARAIEARPRAYATIVGLAVLVPSLLFLWPRQWSDDLVPRFPERERISRESSAPVDRMPAERAAPVPVVMTQPSRPGAGAPPVPVAAARPENRAVSVSREPAEIPTPVRRRPIASAPPPATDTAQNGEVSDATAVVDWLLNGVRGRRQIESP